MAKINNANKGRKRGLSALSISISAILAASAIAGSAVSIWHISQNYQESSEFSKSVNGRLEVDPLAFEQDKTDGEKAKANMKEAAEKLSAWLRDQGQEMYDVSYELYEKEDQIEHPWQGFLNAKFNLDKIDSKWITSKDDEDKKVDNDSYLSFFDQSAFNSNNRTLVYRWYIPQNDTEGILPQYTMIDLSTVMDIPTDVDQSGSQTKVLTDDDGKWGIVYHIKNDENRKLLNAIYNDMLKAYSYTQEEDPEPESNTKELDNWKQPRLYVINNLEGLINEANYHLLNYRTKDDHLRRYREVYNDTQYESFANDYFNGEDDQGNPGSTGARASANNLLSGDYYDFANDKVNYGVANLNIFRWLDFEPGTTKYSIFSSYVEDIITIKDENWKQFFPEKINDTYKNEVATNVEELDKTKLEYFWHGYVSQQDARKYLNNLIKYRLPVKFVSVDLNNDEKAKDKFEKFQTSCLSTDIQPQFVDSIFGGDALVGWLSLGFLIYLIALAIILMVLYRLSGMLGWISLMFMLSMSMLIASISSTMISMSFLFGLFTLSILGFMATLAICGRLKRRLNCNEDTSVMVKKAFKKSLLPIVDVSIVTLIFGICFTYIAPISLNKLGLVLIAGGFLIFIIMYLLNAGMHLLLFNNAITENNFKLFGKKQTNDANQALTQGNHLVPSSIDATKLEFDYYSSMSKKDIKLFDKKTFILLMVLVAIMVVGLVLFGVFGFATNSLFHSSACIAICYEGEGSLLSQPWFIESGLSWIRYTHNEGSPWWYFYCDGINQAAIDFFVDGQYLQLGDTLAVQTIFGSTNQDALIYALVAIVSGAAITSVYAAIRFNWASFVPILLGTIIIPILMISISAICQVKFDHTVVLGFILISIVNNMLTMNIMATIQDAWLRRDAYTKNELKFIIVTALKNNWTYLWTLGLAYLIFLVCFSITAPFGCLYIIILIAIGAVISLFVTPFSVAYLELYFLLIRNNILGQRAIKAQSKVVVNLDEIDEQSIEGINQFTKKKAIPKIEKVAESK